MIILYMERCNLCDRQIIDRKYKEKHHLMPHSKGGKDTVVVCVDCGNQVHQLFTNNDLRDRFNTIEALKSNVDVQKWIRWVRHRPFGVCMKTKKRR